MLDIIIIIAALISFYIGYRRGFIVQLISFVALYLAILVAPTIAEPVGSILFGEEHLAYVGGFFMVIAAVIFVMWFVAPIIGKFIFWNPFKRLNALMGGILTLGVSVIVISSLFAAFDYANIDTSKPNVEKINEYVQQSLDNATSATDITGEIVALTNGDVKTMRKYFKPRFVEYKTLESSALFYPLANFGRAIAPTMDDFNATIRKEAKVAINKEYFLQ